MRRASSFRSMPIASIAGDVADLHPFDEGRREHTARRRARDHAREDDPRIAREVARDALDVVASR